MLLFVEVVGEVYGGVVGVDVYWLLLWFVVE